MQKLRRLAACAAFLCGQARAAERTFSAFGQLRALVPAVQAPLPAASIPGRPAGAAAVDRLCRSSLPVVVVDHFVSAGKVRPYMDVDGDGVPDVGHGDVVAALYEAGGRRVERKDQGGDNSLEKVAELLAQTAADSRAGKPAAAVNLSKNIDVTFDSLNRDLGLTGLDAANIAGRREEVLAALSALMKKHDNEGLEALVLAARALAASGTPLILSAGNQGPDKVNLLGFLPGAVSVGALARDGSKAGFSADNSLVEDWALGEHVIRRVPGGADLNRDGRQDFGALALSGGPALVSRHAGRPVSEAVRSVPAAPGLDDFSREMEGGIAYLRGVLGEHLYETEALVRFFRLGPDRRRSLLARGRYFDATLRYPFDADAQGRVVFDPERSGAPGQAYLLTGTSFSLPALCTY